MIKSVYVDTVIAKQMSEEGEAESQYSEISDSFSEDPNSTYNFSLNQNNVYLQSSFRREQVLNQLSFFFLSTDVGLLLEFIVSPQILFWDGGRGYSDLSTAATTAKLSINSSRDPILIVERLRSASLVSRSSLK